MAFPGMLVVPPDAIPGTCPLDELEVIFPILTGQASISFTYEHIFDTAMNAFTHEAELEKRWLAEQAFQIEIRGIR